LFGHFFVPKEQKSGSRGFIFEAARSHFLLFSSFRFCEDDGYYSPPTPSSPHCLFYFTVKNLEGARSTKGNLKKKKGTERALAAETESAPSSGKRLGLSDAFSSAFSLTKAYFGGTNP